MLWGVTVNIWKTDLLSKLKKKMLALKNLNECPAAVLRLQLNYAIGARLNIFWKHTKKTPKHENRANLWYYHRQLFFLVSKLWIFWPDIYRNIFGKAFPSAWPWNRQDSIQEMVRVYTYKKVYSACIFFFLRIWRTMNSIYPGSNISFFVCNPLSQKTFLAEKLWWLFRVGVNKWYCFSLLWLTTFSLPRRAKEESNCI